MLYSTAEPNLPTWKRPFTVAGVAMKNHFPVSLVRGTKKSDWAEQVWINAEGPVVGQQVLCGSRQRLLVLFVVCLSSLQLASCLPVFGYSVCGCHAVMSQSFNTALTFVLEYTY